MRTAASILLFGGLASAAWAGGLANGAPDTGVAGADTSGAGVRPPLSASAPVTKTPPSEAELRAGLNQRIQAMIEAGEGRRLSDPPRTRTASRPTANYAQPQAAATPAIATPAASRRASVEPTMAEPPSTIAPPAYRGGAMQRARGDYVAPRLDLKTPPAIPNNDLECLTQAIYYEARNESEQGQAAVAEVVINRSRHGAYPRDICQVVYQRNSRTCQFTFTCDGSIGRRPINMTSWARAERIAREVRDGRRSASLPAHSVNYHANYVRPSWGRRLEQVRQIGAHIFYGAPLSGVTPGAGEAAPAPAPVPGRGLQFVRNEALERAYALVTSGGQPSEG